MRLLKDALLAIHLLNNGSEEHELSLCIVLRVFSSSSYNMVLCVLGGGEGGACFDSLGCAIQFASIYTFIIRQLAHHLLAAGGYLVS